MATRKRRKSSEQKKPEPVGSLGAVHSGRQNLHSSGCTVFNCALSDDPYGGWRAGTIANIIGGSSSGKSLLGLTTLAAAHRDGMPHTLITDDSEFGQGFNLSDMFNPSFADALQPPKWKGGEPVFSDTIEDFHMFVKDMLKTGKPFIYLLDSFDSLDAEDDQDKIEAAHKARKEGKEVSGSYGTSKPKKNSDLLRNIVKDLKHTNSLLIIVSQLRDNLNAGPFASKKTRSGGRALKHYSWQEVWLDTGAKITAKKKQIGNHSTAKLDKNRETGKKRQAEFPIYYDLGIDDIGANIDYLLAEGEDSGWKKDKQGRITAPDFDLEGVYKRTIIDHVEGNDLEDDLAQLVGETWQQVENSLKLGRKKRF